MDILNSAGASSSLGQIAVAADLLDEFESLVETSYLWGTPEWLELRKAVIDTGGIKGTTTKQQRLIYKTLRKSGAHWLF
jgi:hypothetical protein